MNLLRILPVLFLSSFGIAVAQSPDLNVKITVHTQAPQDHPRDAYKPIWNYFGADEPNYVYAPKGERLLRELTALSPAPVYMRVHNLLTTGDGDASLKWGSTNAYTEDAQGRPVYDWKITDRIFDALSGAGVRPLVEVGFMPEALSTHPEPYQHTFPKGDVFTGWSYPPKDYDKWSALVSAWATHLHERYGASVDDWLWEVWNEPDIAYWHGSPEEYDRLYDVTAAAIRKVLPHAKIGGPESTGPYDDSPKSQAFLKQFLEHCAHGKNAATGAVGAPLDFISFHPKGSPKVVDGHVQMSIAHQLKAADLGMRIVASFPEWRNTPIIMGENDPEGCAACGVKQNPQNAYRNGPLYGVSIAESTARDYELARGHGVHLQGSVTWAFEFENQPYFAGYRDLATNGVDKPVLNVFREWGMLGGHWLRVDSTGALSLQQMLAEVASQQSDVNAVATQQGNEVDVLVWNYDDRDVEARDAHVSLHILGLKSSVAMEEYLVDHDHSNAYTAWLEMGSPEQPTIAQHEALVKASGLEMVRSEQLNSDGVIPLKLQRQGVALIRLTPQ
jgi:xylan 1,4-beta-xylosidase